MRRYAVIVEPSGNGFGAYAPDIPGCVAVGETIEETLVFMKDALEAHLRMMRDDGDPIPEPSTIVREFEVA